MGAENSKLRSSSLYFFRKLSSKKFWSSSGKYSSSTASLENLGRMRNGGKSASSTSNLYNESDKRHHKTKSEMLRYKDRWPYPHVEKDFLPVYAMKQENQKDFTIAKVVASGAYGNVLRGHENSTKREVAIKVIDKSKVLSEGPGAIQQCKDEVIIQSELPKNSYIVELVAFWQTRNRLYLVLEYIPNGELFDLWKHIRQFSDSLARFYITQITIALDFLHRNNVVYRDLKMENILLNEHANVKLIDFGLSKQLQQGDQTYTTCGTLQYTAPEVLRGDAYGHEVDWWSLGVLGYALLAGKFPVFGARNHIEMRNMVASHVYRMPLHFTNEAADLFTQLLQKNPHNRIQSMKQLIDSRYYRGLLNQLSDCGPPQLQQFVTKDDVDKLPDSFLLRHYFYKCYVEAETVTRSGNTQNSYKQQQQQHYTVAGMHVSLTGSSDLVGRVNHNPHHHHQQQQPRMRTQIQDDPGSTVSSVAQQQQPPLLPSQLDNISADGSSSDYAEPIWNMTSGAAVQPAPSGAATTAGGNIGGGGGGTTLDDVRRRPKYKPAVDNSYRRSFDGMQLPVTTTGAPSATNTTTTSTTISNNRKFSGGDRHSADYSVIGQVENPDLANRNAGVRNTGTPIKALPIQQRNGGYPRHRAAAIPNSCTAIVPLARPSQSNNVAAARIPGTAAMSSSQLSQLPQPQPPPPPYYNYSSSTMVDAAGGPHHRPPILLQQNHSQYPRPSQI